ncbi:polysaccharide pyruvyl transferase family protein [Gordonia alkanivorans]|uniref:polysaccharide pyruvyl transferase family protein n=1 Tax=Gordonia alkanivorans TaxID=84096 RepID=UPI00244869EB|nr:polysaccharide pyruvyl transferase family protein [Gordonia alkanivorans]MDH3046683.1 polysaccharide pyruvyl transferase family protein [Gordonia alkanivorans]MDJ0010345.1 polysaccharide pyruvyl transferase family protein [Gordonia alkanivorans]MDJ0100108.1 polysaccharide pyruvyl transferase family protein [Gordonia alkanivorans]MDJ0495973.1 polysaccharide pyruvyl transferase family protein [Gordonia alkanivorans]
MREKVAAGRADAPIVVLHAIKPPGAETRYANQLQAGVADGCEYIYYTPRTLLTRRWDVLHVHWPEILVADRNPIRHLAKVLVLAFLVLKTRVTGAKVVRTVHNETPHEGIGRFDGMLVRMLDGMVDRYVVLNESQLQVPRSKGTVHIQHGDYGDVFGNHVKASTVTRESKRLLFFGRINRYKGVQDLLRVFRSVEDEDLRLRLVGKPTEDLRSELELMCAEDSRVSRVFDFVPDRQLVDEVLASSLVVLPYTEMNNSGCLLVALSLNRPVLVPRTKANEVIAQEAGAEWVQMYDGALRREHLVEALGHASALLMSGRKPRFEERSWSEVGRKHLEAYRSVVASARRPKLFVLLQGQEDNFGDVLIRRNLLALLREYGEPNVYLGSSRDSFMPQMNSCAGDVFVNSGLKWYLAALFHLAFRGGTYVYKPGEIQITAGGMKEHLAVLPLAIATRFSSGRMVRFGSGTRDDPSRPMAALFRALLRLDSATYWRDSETRSAVRRGKVSPDLAFYSRSAIEGVVPGDTDGRILLVVSIRGDRDLVSDTWIGTLSSLAAERSLRIVTTYQVDRDRDRNRALAEAHSWEFFDPGLSGTEMPDGVRLEQLYDRAAVVVSDRLHVLVYALTRGAAIVGIATDKAGKLRRCLGIVGLADRVVDRTQPPHELERSVTYAMSRIGDDLVALQSAGKAVEAEFDRAMRPDGRTRVTP